MPVNIPDRWGTPKTQEDIVKAQLPEKGRDTTIPSPALKLLFNEKPINEENLKQVVFNALRSRSTPQRFSMWWNEVEVAKTQQSVQKIQGITNISKQELSDKMAKIFANDETVVGVMLDVAGSSTIYRLKTHRTDTPCEPFFYISYIAQ